jgi:fumarate hydratase class I
LNQLRPILNGGVIYHCGPVVSGLLTKQYRFVAAGPTTSIREEPYQEDIINFFNVRGVIGKGGMGLKTLKACHEAPAVYFHAIGGAASLIAETVTEILGVHKLEFGVPEAMWVIKVKDLPVIVTMDAHEHSLHTTVSEASRLALKKLLG